MEYVDPLELYRFDHAPDWIYNPAESVFGTTVFDNYAQSARKLSLQVLLPSADPSVPPREWLLSTSAMLQQRLPGRLNFMLLPGEGSAIGGCILGNGQRIRGLVLRGRDLDIIVVETSTDPTDGPDLNEHLRRIHGSLYLVDTEESGRKTDPDEEAYAGIFHLIRSSVVKWGRTPETRLVFTLSEVIARLAERQFSPLLISQAELLVRLQRNSQAELSGDSSKSRLLDRMQSGVYARIAALHAAIGREVQAPGNPLDAAFLIAELIRDTMPAAAPEAVRAALLEEALSGYLVAARRAPSLLSMLFVTAATALPPRSVSVGSDEVVLLSRIAYVAGKLGHARSVLGDSGAAAEADRVSVAALRLLHTHDPDYVLDSYPVAVLLGNTLFAAAEHLSAADDPLSRAEAEALRAEADQFGTDRAPDELTRVGLQQARDFLAALDDGRTADAAQLAAMILDPSWEDAGSEPVSEQIVRAQMAQLLGRTEEMAAATEAALTLLGVSFDQPPGPDMSPGPSLDASARDSALQRADHFVALSYLLGALQRRADAVALLNRAARIVGEIAPVGELSMRVLDTGAAAVAADDGLLAARLSIGAALVVDGLRLEQLTGENRIRHADGDAESRVYRNAVTRNLSQDRKFEALCMADRARGRSLLETVHGGGRVLPAEHGPAGAAWAAVPASPTALEQLGAAVHEEVSRRYRITATAIPLLPDQLFSLGFHGVNFLIPQPLDGELALFLLGGTDIIHVERVPTDLGALERQAQQVRDALRIDAVARGGPQSDRTAVPAAGTVPDLSVLLRGLYDALIGPVAQWLKPGQPITIVPHRDVGLLPWALLISPEGRYLIDDFGIGVVPSLSIWQTLWQRGLDAPTLRAYVAADPRLEPGLRVRGYGPLPSARTDAERIRRHLELAHADGSAAIIAVGADATESSYRANAAHATLVHLACHAALHEPTSESCLYLAPDTAHDGKLKVAEVTDTPLDRALVFLAACDTGQGRLSSDGVIGLGQAFLDAGAQAVVLTLCKVADAVASTVTERFYQRLLAPGRGDTVIAALRAAMLGTRDDLDAGRIVDANGTVLQAEPQLWGTYFVLGRAYAQIGRADGRPT